MIMDTSTENIAQQQSPAYALMKRGKRGAAALIATECILNISNTQEQIIDNTFDTTESSEPLIRCKLLDSMLDVLLNPYDAIGEWNNLDWLRWLMAGGKTLDEFSSAVKDYDSGTCCGLVWTANYVAYRCRTCGISPCMSLCGECFKHGDHTGHDFNMFRSQAGGACDCGDTSVMKSDGFCSKHKILFDPASNINCKQPPADLLMVTERIMPRILLRLVQYLRENSKIADSKTGSTQHGPSNSVGANTQQHNLLLMDLDPFLGMLHDLSSLGAAMRRVMTMCLTDERIYRWACNYYSTTNNIIDNNSSQPEQKQTIYTIYTDKVRHYYTEAICQFSSVSNNRHNSTSENINTDNINLNNSCNEFGQDKWLADSVTHNKKLKHTSFLQEIVFWTVRYEFPQKMVCFLLNMLPDAIYKEKITEAFVMHYGCIARVLATTSDSDTLSNHIVHISVQLFSNETLATRMVNKFGLLKVMVSSLRQMMQNILIQSTLHDSTTNTHKVVDCSKSVMRDHCYWPLVSDFNNVLSHRPIAIQFMSDDNLLNSWFSYLSMFQGMNVNFREIGPHVEFEPNTYYAAFSAELEASAYPMWAMISHLTTVDTWHLTSHVLRACLKSLKKWLIDVGYFNQNDSLTFSSEENYINQSIDFIRRSDDHDKFSFHIPLHRYLSVFICQAIRAQKARIEDIIPYSNIVERDRLFLTIAAHPVRAQAAFYEIIQGSWLRNGLQIKGQAMTYIQSNFCISMVDADIFLLQLCLSELSNANIFMSLILEKFKVYDWMKIMKPDSMPQIMISGEYDITSSMESFLIFLATIIGVRTNLCSDEDYEYCQSQLEIVTLLCVSDKTHSQLMELMPERCTTSNMTNSSQNRETPRDFETLLLTIAEFKRPQFEESGNMHQGIYVPLPKVWQNLYDPIHVLLRAVHRRDFQSSMDRYTAYMRSMGLLKQDDNLWPPYRTPQAHNSEYNDPSRALLTRIFHGVVWHCLYRSTIYQDVNEQTLSLLIYLLDQAWICYNTSSTVVKNAVASDMQQPMDIDQSTRTSDEKYQSRNIRIKPSPMKPNEYLTNEILNNWYDNDDLIQNLCTIITNVELPLPLNQYNFITANEETIAPPVTSTIFDYFTTSVATGLTQYQENTVSSNDMANNQPNNTVPPLTVMAGNEMPITASQSSQNSIRPPFYNLNTVITSSTLDSALNSVKQRLQFLNTPYNQPSTSSSSKQSTTDVYSRIDLDTYDEDFVEETKICKQDHLDNNMTSDTNNRCPFSLIHVNESIISLLLRLHSHLSGKPDSYQPPSVKPDINSVDKKDTNFAHETLSKKDNTQNKIQECGNGVYYVGRLLDKLTKESLKCYECVIQARIMLWPKAVVMREAATQEDREHKRQELKRLARDKQRQLMNEMALAQKAFLDNARRSGDLDSTDTPSTSVTNMMECDDPISSVDTAVIDNSTSSALNAAFEENSDDITDERIFGLHHETTQTADCVICNQTVVLMQNEQQVRDPIGLVILIQGTNLLAHRRHIPQTNGQQQIETGASNYENNILNINESNYYQYWPELPTFKSQQFTSINENPVLQHHHQGIRKINNNDITTYASHSDRRKNLLTQYFDNLDKADLEIGYVTTTSSSQPIGGNVHVQTCGHYLHFRCWNSYLASLRGTQRFNSDRGEYSCPLCRQLANSLMPLIPKTIDIKQQNTETTSNIMTQTALSNNINQITNLIEEQKNVLMKTSSTECSNFNTSEHNNFHDENNLLDTLHDIVSGRNYVKEITDKEPLLDAVNRCVNDLISNTVLSSEAQSLSLLPQLLTPVQQDKIHKLRWHNVVSIAWTNIQIELVQHNNSLLKQSPLKNDYKQDVAESSSNNNFYNILPKRNCIAPLLKILRVSARSLLTKYQTNDCYPLNDIWFKLIGIIQPETNILPPLLIRDPCSILLQLVLLLPTLERDMFDTLIKLVFNMQIYSSALKVAITWNYNYKQRKITENSIEDLVNSSCDIPTASIDRIESNDMQPSTPLFSRAVDMAKTIVFLSQDNSETVDIEIDKIDDQDCMIHQDIINQSDVPTINTEDKECMFLLEAYGRQCTLPFLRFASLLKRHIYGDIDENLDNHEMLTILSSPQIHKTQINLNVENSKLLDNEEQSTSYNLNTHSSHHNWSRDDYEFLALTQYLKLLNYNKDRNVEKYNDFYKDNQVDISQATLSQPPSAMEAVTWPHWSYSDTDDNVWTTIPRTWLTSFRESLTAKMPAASSLGENTTSAIVPIDPNSNAAATTITTTTISTTTTTTTTTTIAARLLLAIDSCNGVGCPTMMSNNDYLTNACSLLPTINWIGPRLLRLPNLYDDVFQYYHGRPCHRCLGVPRETSVCLVCGTVVCLKENCCKTNGIYEAVQHSLECGSSTSIFLVVTSSSIIVIRGKRACLWGSVYLDAFGEEDRELKRGKPLYLSSERYKLLERQWLAHRFDHTNKKWVWHRDAL